MTQELKFEDWFDNITLLVLDETGFEFKDKESVRADYDAGRDLHDVAAEIAAEYKD